MNKFAIAAATAAALTTAAPVVAQEAPVADPFVATQGLALPSLAGASGLAIIGGLAFIVAIGASSDSR